MPITKDGKILIFGRGTLPIGGVSPGDVAASQAAIIQQINKLSIAISRGFRTVGDWDASTGVYPSARPDGSSIDHGDTFVVRERGAIGGIVFEVGDLLVAVEGTGGSLDWIRRAGTATSAIQVSTADGASVQSFIDRLQGERSVSRSSLVQFVQALGSSTVLIADGAEFRAEGLSYIWQHGSTVIPDLPNLIPVAPVSLDHWGTPRDGVTDVAPFMQLALNWTRQDAGRKVVCHPAGIYVLATTLNVEGAHCRIDFGKSIFRKTTDTQFLRFHGNPNPTIVPLTESYVIGGTTIKAALPEAPKRNDWIRIVSDAVNPNDRSRIGNPNKYRVQEYASVGAGSTADAIVLGSPLRFVEGVDDAEVVMGNPYTPGFNARLAKLDKTFVLELEGGIFDYPIGNAFTAHCFEAIAAFRPSFRGMQFFRCPSAGIHLNGTIYARVEGCSAEEFANNEHGTQNGYGVCDGGHFTRVEDCDFGKCRHAYTTLRLSLGANTQNIWMGGNTYQGKVVRCVGRDCTSTAFDTHHGSVECEIIDCVSEGGESAYGFRGVGHRLVGSKARGGAGPAVIAFVESGGIAGSRLQYVSQVLVSDCDLQGGIDVMTSRTARMTIENSTIRTSQIRTLASSGHMIIRGSVRVIVDNMKGAYPIVPPGPTFLAPVTRDPAYAAQFPNPYIVVEDGASLELNTIGFGTSLPTSIFFAAAACQIINQGTISVVAADGQTVFSGNGSFTGRGRTAALYVSAASPASVILGLGANSGMNISLSDGTVVQDTVVEAGATSTGHRYLKFHDGTLRVYGSMGLGNRAASGAGVFGNPYSTGPGTITFGLPAGLSFTATPLAVLQYVGPTAQRGGYVEYDVDSTTAVSIAGIRGKSFDTSNAAGEVRIHFEAVGRWR